MKKSVLLILGVLVSLVGYGASRSVEQAEALAEQFVANTENNARKQMGTASKMQFAKQYMQQDGVTPALYVFNKGDQAGYVIVSADDRTTDILGYADNGQFDADNVNPNMQWWLNRYAKQMASLDASATPVIKSEATTTAIAPLLGGVKWEQEAPYYNKCPKDLLTQETSMTGCVATAAAMIMKKWEYPQHGTGTHSYEWCQFSFKPYQEKCKDLSLKFDTISFDWANMRDTYKRSYTKQEAQAVATLMYACGVACNMEYSSDGSGAYTDDMGYGLITYFGYRYSIFVSASSRNSYLAAKGYDDIALKNTKFSCKTSELEAYLNSDLEAGRPVLMGGCDGWDGGHEFVCDGRDTAGKFHINWGWGGDENGYYTLTALGKTYDFSDDIDMLIGLEPDIQTDVQEHKAEQLPVRKWMHQGRLYIEHNGRVYDVLGQSR